MASEARLRLSDIAEGGTKAVTIDGEEVVVAKAGGQCFALGGICPHDGAPLVDGAIEDGKLICPWHFTEFDLKTGEALQGMTDEPVPVYDVEIEGDELRISKR